MRKRPHQYKICLVVPCFNEAARLQPRVFLEFLQDYPLMHYCFVDDGSTDDTIGVLRTLQAQAPQRVSVIRLKKNVGKAEAVRQGSLFSQEWAEFDYIGYFDADLATPLEEIAFMLAFNDRDEPLSFLFGSRILRLGGRIERSLFRHYLGRIFATVSSTMLKLPIYDTQCGAKLVRSDLVPTIYSQPFFSRWMFDIELFFRLKSHFGKRLDQELVEVPVRVWYEIGDSRLGFGDAIKFPLELLRIYRAYRFQGLGKHFSGQIAYSEYDQRLVESFPALDNQQESEKTENPKE